jgi:nucleoside-diphosphate-sugar epimerase
MRVLVTGAGGFLGRRLVPALLAAGHEVACLTRNPAELPEAWGKLPVASTDSSGNGVRRLCADFRPQVVIHLAALYINEHQFEDVRPLVEVNVLLGVHLLEAMRSSGCDKLVCAGTSWQHYEGADYNPTNLYAATKQAFSAIAEYFMQVAGLRLIELHLYDSYGEGDTRPRLLNHLQACAKGGQTLALSPGEQKLHLVHVDDLVVGFIMASEQIFDVIPGARKIFRLPAAKAISLRELVEAFNAADPSCPVQVEWGGRPYREREVFLPWEAANVLPAWQPHIDLQMGLRRLRKNNFV